MQKHISFEFLPCLVQHIYVHIHFSPAVVAILDFEVFAAIFELGIKKI